jgi:hypothetical protein
MQRTRLISLAALGGIMVSATAFAQQTPPPPPITPPVASTAPMPAPMGTSAMPMDHAGRMGVHDMPATVTSIDKTTGMIRVESEGMALRLHFPPASLADVDKGDTITLHLSFSK